MERHGEGPKKCTAVHQQVPTLIRHVRNAAQTLSKNWLALIVALQAFTLLAVLGTGPGATPARADGIPDAGAQQQALIDQAKATNAKLDQLISLLSGGNVEVKVRKLDDSLKAR